MGLSDQCHFHLDFFLCLNGLFLAFILTSSISKHMSKRSPQGQEVLMHLAFTEACLWRSTNNINALLEELTNTTSTSIVHFARYQLYLDQCDCRSPIRNSASIIYNVLMFWVKNLQHKFYSIKSIKSSQGAENNTILF